MIGKTCRKCNAFKSIEYFHKNKNMADGRLNTCTECAKARARVCYDANPDKFRKRSRDCWRKSGSKRRDPEYLREWHLKRKYDLTIEEYEEMLSSQGGVCAACGKPPASRRHAVDHDHKTGKVRGILCGNCNRALGYLNDNHSTILSLAAYLAAHTITEKG